jgi:hypothetical protein
MSKRDPRRERRLGVYPGCSENTPVADHSIHIPGRAVVRMEKHSALARQKAYEGSFPVFQLHGCRGSAGRPAMPD